jgi:hypothetical protein
MEISIITIILGVVLVVGIIFYQKPKPGEANDKTIETTYRRGIEVLSHILKWGIPIFLILIGIYFYRITDQEAKQEREIREREIASQIHVNQLMDIMNTPINEREMKVIAMNFEPKGTNDFGRFYERDATENKIELFDSGIVRFLTN